MTKFYSTVENCKLIELPKIHNPAGNITVIQNGELLPFEVKRVYYLYDIPGGAARGGHAHKSLYQLLVSVSGSFDIITDDGNIKKIINLNKPYYGLIIPPGIWREIVNFSSGSICLVLASQNYDEKDYIRDYNEFLCFRGKKK